MEYKTLNEVIENLIDYRGKTPKKSKHGIKMLSAKTVKMGFIDYDNAYTISEDEFKKFNVRGEIKKGDILLTTEAPLGCVAKLSRDNVGIAQRLVALRGKKNVLDNDFLMYYLMSEEGQHELLARETGTTVTGIKQSEIRKIKVPIPSINIQRKIAKSLSILDKKIELNNQINNNLFEEIITIYENKFKNINQGNKTIGDYIIPKRGKSLLASEAIYGDVPVIAGGIKPSTFHNIANTLAPVITISASGANAGYTNLWECPVWSSDSSYIDNTITNNVYFWYITLKLRQKEIFDSQTGSAQPHIYPHHIADLPIMELNRNNVIEFNNLVKPFFKEIELNKNKNHLLEQLRDTLLPKLMNGEIDLDNIEI